MMRKKEGAGDLPGSERRGGPWEGTTTRERGDDATREEGKSFLLGAD